MNTPCLAIDLPQNDLLILQGAFDALRHTTGLQGQLVSTQIAIPDNHRTSAVVDIIAEGNHHRYVTTLKRVDRFATLGVIKLQLTQLDMPGLLVAPYISPQIAARCRALDIPFIDTAGNAYLHEPGLLIFVTGQRPRTDTMPRPDTTSRAVTAAGLRMVFALLCRPELLNAPYREIARAAGVALGTVGGVFRDLQERGYTTGGTRNSQRRLLEPRRLIEEWVMHYPLTLRPRLHPRRFRAPAPDWWQHANLTPFGAQWGGEVAADKLTGYLKPETVTLYLRPEPDRSIITRLVAAHQLRADSKGTIEMLDAFWDVPAEQAHLAVAPPLLVYADLVALHEPRALDAAQLLYDREIAHASRHV